MTPERWARVQQVFGAAVVRSPASRASFIEGECGSDLELRREVESLLAANDEATSQFLASPQVEAAPPTRQTLAPGARLGHYEILGQIGAGGMGQVYRARDRTLEREVAIKVLPAHLMASAAARSRFEREAKAVAALSHPNILAIHDFGMEGGVSFAVTELLSGQTLREKLKLGPIGQSAAIDLALQLAKGLAAAHESGVVHRDLKPENIFLSRDGHLKILDFGLAKREPAIREGAQTGARTVTALTEAGTVMGTAGYMSPEQVRGESVDHRSDIFSFGAVLYEMLAGRRAFQGKSAGDTMAAILRDEPPRISTAGIVPPELEHVVSHCLEKDRDNRFQSARDIVFALTQASRPTASVARSKIPARRWLVAAAALISIVAVVVTITIRRSSPTAVAPKVRRIAVLPFENLGAPEDGYFADGIADEIRSKLTSLRGVEVIARSSSIPYKGTTKTPEQIARDLGVEYLLTATVRWQKTGGASRVHVTPELVAVREGVAPASKWQRSFDAALTDVFQVQSEIASRVAASLGVALGSGDERRLRETPTSNLSAYDAFLRGEESWTRHGGWVVGAAPMIQAYEQAVALDPGFALAWSRLSRSRTHLYSDAPTSELADLAGQAADKAIALAPGSADARLAVGEYMFWVRHDAEASLRELEEAHRLGPSNVDVLVARSYVEAMMGRQSESREHVREANRLDPLSMATKLRVADELMSERNFDRARAMLDQVIADDPKNTTAVLDKVMTYLEQGNLDSARRTVKEALGEIDAPSLVAFLANVNDLAWVLDEEQRSLLLRLSPSAFESEQVWAICLAQASWLNKDETSLRKYSERAAAAFQKHIEANPTDAEAHSLRGLALVFLGRKQEAIREGERALALRPDPNMGERPYCEHLLARIYLLASEPDKALDHLQLLLATDYYLTAAWLRIDPSFESLRSNPRFQKLAGATQ